MVPTRIVLSALGIIRVGPPERDRGGHDSTPACLGEQLPVQHCVGDRPEHQHGHRHHRLRH
jgi:hypothetical protein